MPCRLPAAFLLAGALALVFPAGCQASKSEPACDRLQHYSCDCFPACQSDLVDIIDSQDAQACNQAIADGYGKWKQCAGTCTVNCEYGWGACALSYYREVGKSADQACGPGATDAGSDAH